MFLARLRRWLWPACGRTVGFSETVWILLEYERRLKLEDDDG